MPSSRRTALLLILFALAIPACDKDKGTPASTSKDGAAVKDLDSKDILARAEVAAEVEVKHVLIGWKELAKAYGGKMDKRAAERSNADAAKLAEEIAAKLRADPSSIDEVAKEYSEDPGSAAGKSYLCNAGARLVPGFKNLGMRLKPNEVGIVKSDYGYHVMIRVPADPVESADILARAAPPGGKVYVQHIVIGWKDVPAAQRQPLDPRATERTKADADKLAQELLAKIKAGGDMTALMKEYSEDKGSKDDGKVYDVDASSRLVPPFKNLSLRLEMGEAGIVKSVFGWHIIKRVEAPPPPPPDSVESADILARQPVTEKAVVKHILLGWKEVNSGDPRGKERDRATLEALVKKTMAALKKGDPIEPLMAELSEDGGSAKAGTTYEVTPDAGLVPEFKALGLRLNVGEVGAVKTQFGIHIMKRME
jgi:parvulin-like peptidyl-prolyl isomerase